MYKALIAQMLLMLYFTSGAYGADTHQHSHNHGQDTWPQYTDQPIISAHFELVNGDNHTVTEKNFHDQYLLIGFGFRHCKHVCPTILQDWALMMKQLPASKAAALQPLMISLDPERDSPQQMDRYSKQFNPRFQGLSGSPTQIAKVAKNFRVSYQKVGPADNYQINHSSLSYLVSPEGQVIDYFGFGTPPQQLAEKISKHLQ